jgi:hypothetical protein
MSSVRITTQTISNHTLTLMLPLLSWVVPENAIASTSFSNAQNGVL